MTLLALFCVYWFCFRGVALKISPETTKITEPRTADGKHIDYFQVVVAISDPKVPPAKNGFRMVAEAIGRIPCENINLEYWKKLSQKLDIDPLAPPTTKYYAKDRILYQAANEELGITTPLYDPQKVADRAADMPEDHPWLQNYNPKAGDWVKQKNEQMMEKPWIAEEFPVLEQYIQGISPTLDIVGKAVRMDAYYIPILEPKSGIAPEILLPCAQVHREFVRDLRRRIMFYLGKGETDKAVYDAITIYRLGQFLQKDALLVNSLVGIAMQYGIGFPAVVYILQNENITREQIEQLLSEIGKMPEKLPISDNMLCEEFMMYSIISALSQKKYAFNIFSGDVQFEGGEHFVPILAYLNYYGYDWNIVARNARNFFDMQTEIIDEPNPSARAKMKEELQIEISRISQRYEYPNLISSNARLAPGSYWRMIFVSTRSKMMGDSIGMQFTGFFQNNFRGKINLGKAAVDLTRLACALELYKLDEGRYPDRLDKLQGKYLESIPGDPCTETDEPFRYRLEERSIDGSGKPVYGYLMYGVGSKEEDIWGKTNLVIPGTEDLYFPNLDRGETNIPIRM